MKQTRGEYLVGTAFNPSNNSQMDIIEQKSAELIDLIDAVELPNGNEGEVLRLKECAIISVENAAMFAVKAITKPARQ
jgi:hypothetical protein